MGKFPWRKVPHYLAGQYLGAFLGSATVFCVYWDALVWYEHDRGAWRGWNSLIVNNKFDRISSCIELKFFEIMEN